MTLQKYCLIPCQSEICNCNRENEKDFIMNDELDISNIIKERFKFDTDESKNWLLNIIKGDIPPTITFQKVDGEIRVMKCSTNEAFLPKVVIDESVEIKPKKERKESTTSFRVFDVEKQDWRSIKWDSMISITIPL